MKETQKAKIAKNLGAFEHNFGEVRIEDEAHGHGFFVFYPADSTQHIQYCENIDYLNGWLYGVVQGRLRIEFAIGSLNSLQLVKDGKCAKV